MKEMEWAESLDDPKIEHSKAMNELIDKYFLYDGQSDLLASLSLVEDVQDILPLNHFESAWEISELTSDVFHLMK